MSSLLEPLHLETYDPIVRWDWHGLWERGRQRVLDAWDDAIAAAAAAPKPGDLGSAYTDPRRFLAAIGTPTETTALLDGLASVFTHERPAFEAWAWQLITGVGRKLLYDEVVLKLDRSAPAEAIRLAAFLSAVGRQPATAHAGLVRWAAAWRNGFDRARGATLPHAVDQLLLVPGRSAGRSWSDANALTLCRGRAQRATKTLRKLLKDERRRVLVVCSGGMVRSPTPESTFIARALRDELQKLDVDARRRVTLWEDPLARHTANNARALARLVIYGRRHREDAWVVTDPGHYPLFRPRGVRGQWVDWAMSGLSAADRAQIMSTTPVAARRGRPVFAHPPRVHGWLQDLAPTTLVLAPGNALDP